MYLRHPFVSGRKFDGDEDDGCWVDQEPWNIPGWRVSTKIVQGIRRSGGVIQQNLNAPKEMMARARRLSACHYSIIAVSLA